MADTGTAVSTGDLITAAKMSLKLETTADRPALGITDNSGAGSFAMNIVVASTYGADRALTITTGDAARGLTLSGDLSIAGALTTAAAFTTAGAFALTLTSTNTTNATIPAGTVTLADLGTAQTIAGAKTFGSSLLKVNNPAATFAYTFVAGALLASYNITLPTLGASDVMVCEAHGATLTNKTLTSPAINTATIAGGTATALTGLGIRSTGAAYDLTIASTEVFTLGRTLTITLGDAARTLTLGGDVTTVGALTTAAAFSTTGTGNAITLTATGATVATLPAGTITLAQLGANSFTGAQTLDGNVDTVLNPTNSPIIDVGADIFETGTFIDVAYDTAETATGVLIGASINLNTNVTPLAGQNITGVTTQTAAFTNAAAAATVITAYQLPTAGALVSNDAGATITWYGADLQMPNITQTSGTMTATGIRITEGTTTSGTATGLTINVTRAIALTKASDIILAANTAAALEISDGTTKVLTIDTRATTSGVVLRTWNGIAPTFVSAAGSTWSADKNTAIAVTVTGGVGVTAMDGLQYYMDTPTLAADGATTVTTASTLYIKPPALGANMTITNNRIINTSVAGCFLTAAGVWTDACAEEHKTGIKALNLKSIPKLLDNLNVVNYHRKDSSDGGYERFGVIADDAPDFLADASHKGIAPQYMAGFALAAAKWLQNENEQLKKRLAQLEKKLATV